MIILLATLVDSHPRWFMQRFSPKASSVMEKKIFKGFYHIWAWRPSWSTDRDHFSNLSFPHPKEAPYEIWAKLAQRLQRRSRLKMLTDGRTDGRRTKSDHNSSSWAELRWAKKNHFSRPCLGKEQTNIHIHILTKFYVCINTKRQKNSC